MVYVVSYILWDIVFFFSFVLSLTLLMLRFVRIKIICVSKQIWLTQRTNSTNQCVFLWTVNRSISSIILLISSFKSAKKQRMRTGNLFQIGCYDRFIFSIIFAAENAYDISWVSLIGNNGKQDKNFKSWRGQSI